MKIITQSCLSLLNSFLLISRFSVSLKSLNNYFFRRFAYKSILNRFWSSNHFSTSSCFLRFLGSRIFRVQVFQGPGFSGSRFFMVQVFHGPGFSGSRFFRVRILEVAWFLWSKKLQINDVYCYYNINLFWLVLYHY